MHKALRISAIGVVGTVQAFRMARCLYYRRWTVGRRDTLHHYNMLDMNGTHGAANGGGCAYTYVLHTDRLQVLLQSNILPQYFISYRDRILHV